MPVIAAIHALCSVSFKSETVHYKHGLCNLCVFPAFPQVKLFENDRIRIWDMCVEAKGDAARTGFHKVQGYIRGWRTKLKGMLHTEIRMYNVPLSKLHLPHEGRIATIMIRVMYFVKRDIVE